MKNFSVGFYIRMCMLLFVLIVITFECVTTQKFKIEFLGHLERAANTTLTETALNELGIGVDYLEIKQMTSGFTSVVWNTPDEDVGYFYTNLKNAYANLHKINYTGTEIEKSNALLKLKESLIYNNGKHGDKVIYPDDLQYYQNKYIWAFFDYSSGFLFIYLILYALYWMQKYR